MMDRRGPGARATGATKLAPLPDPRALVGLGRGVNQEAFSKPRHATPPPASVGKSPNRTTQNSLYPYSRTLLQKMSGEWP